MHEILIETLMSPEVQCALPSTPITEIVRRMRLDRHSCVLITESGKPLGIITERDVVKHFSDVIDKRANDRAPAGELMSSPPITIEAKTTLFEALVITRSRGIRHLPVVDAAGTLVGLVTETDIVAAHLRTVQKQSEILDAAVAQRTQELLEANKRLRELCLEDELLKIGNRRAMEVDLAHSHAAALRYRRPYAIILCDIDHFKPYNDHYGHAAGDKALQKIAAILRENIRESDRVYRYGGEELLLLLPETNRRGAENLGQKLLNAVVRCAIPHERHSAGVVTLSAGIASLDEHSDAMSWEELLQSADRALYRAKNAGRNQIV